MLRVNSVKKKQQRPVAGMAAEWLLDGETGGTFLVVSSKMFYALQSTCFMCTYTCVYNMTWAITVLVTAVSQNEP